MAVHRTRGFVTSRYIESALAATNTISVILDCGSSDIRPRTTVIEKLLDDGLVNFPKGLNLFATERSL